MTYVLAYNPSDGPELIDEQGRLLGGREWGAVDTADPMARSALDAGRLRTVEPPKPKTKTPAEPAAVDAAAEVNRLTSRADQLQPLDKDVLHDAAVDAGLIEPDDNPHKRQLIAALARTDLPIPAAAPAAPTTPPTEES